MTAEAWAAKCPARRSGSVTLPPKILGSDRLMNERLQSISVWVAFAAVAYGLWSCLVGLGLDEFLAFGVVFAVAIFAFNVLERLWI